jgi:hypothetical protein
MTTSDDVSTISGVSPRLTIRRHLDGYAYSKTSQASRTTPQYRYFLMVDGIDVDSASTRTALRSAARKHGADYIAEIDGRKATGR